MWVMGHRALGMAHRNKSNAQCPIPNSQFPIPFCPMPYKKRVLICSIGAIASGLVGGYLGAQISIAKSAHQCQAGPWGFQKVCSTLLIPGALFQGSTAGVWTGTVLGAFVFGSATRPPHKNGTG